MLRVGPEEDEAMLSRRALLLAVLILESHFGRSATAQSCGTGEVTVQVLGSGGPDLRDKRASSSYLVW